MKPIVFHPEAEEELRAAIAYYEERRDGLGLEFQTVVEETLQSIQRNPQLKPIYLQTKFRKWVLPRFPYTIFCLERADDIWIGAIAHQKRRPGYWRQRASE